MPGFSRIEIEGYKRLRDVKLDLRPLNVLVGGNGAGKTSLLDVFALLAASAEGKLNSYVSGLGGFESIRSIGAGGQMTLIICTEETALEYRLDLTARGPGFLIAGERLRECNGADLFRVRNGEDIEYAENVGFVRAHPSNPSEPALGQIGNAAGAVAVRELLKASSLYRPFGVGVRDAIRAPQKFLPADLPGKDGEFIASCLHHMKETQPDRYEAVHDALRSAFPDFEKLMLPALAAGTLAFTWKDKSLSRELYAHELSEGTLRFLWLVTLLQSPGLTEITLIDEPETSLHPELMSLLVGLLREASLRSQIIVATQSPTFVQFLEPNEVIAVDRDERGFSSFTWADSFDLKPWLEDYTLDEVWRKGLVGGRQ